MVSSGRREMKRPAVSEQPGAKKKNAQEIRDNLQE